MADYQRSQPQPRQFSTYKAFQSENSQSTSQILAVLALLPVGGTLLLLSGLILAGTVVGLSVSAPLFVIFSPVLVPAAIVIGLAVGGFLTSGAFGITGVSSLAWLANHLRGAKASLPETAEQAKRRVQDTAGYLGQKTRETGQAIQSKAQEGGRAAQQETGRAQEGTKT
ncbi:hypothetical protein UlMin_007877 [Ulmus minor]